MSSQSFQRYYGNGPLNEPPPHNEPPAILTGDLSLGLLHFIYCYRCVASTIEKIGAVIATVLPKIRRFFSKN